MNPGANFELTTSKDIELCCEEILVGDFYKKKCPILTMTLVFFIFKTIDIDDFLQTLYNQVFVDLRPSWKGPLKAWKCITLPTRIQDPIFFSNSNTENFRDTPSHTLSRAGSTGLILPGLLS